MKSLFAIALLAFGLIVPAGAQTFGFFSSTAQTVSNATTTVNADVDLRGTGANKVGLTIVPYFSAADAGTSNVVFNFDLSINPGRTNHSTTVPLSYTMAANGTNVLKGYVWFSQTNFVHATSIRWRSVVTTQTNLVTVNMLEYSIGP